MRLSVKIFSSIMSLLFLADVYGEGFLSANIRFDSQVLNYAVQYRVYTPADFKSTDKLASLYVTDGQDYLNKGKMQTVLDNEIAIGNIKPIIAIFIDPRDPDNLKVNRRNQQFFCNPDYVSFIVNELLPTIDNTYPTSNKRQDRVIQGLSFGGLNAACFGLMAYQEFSGISMHSPANSEQLKNLQRLYGQTEKLPLKMYMSFGNYNDNHIEGRKFRNVLQQKGYDLEYKEVPFAHEWRNWRPLIDDSLRYFFAIKH